MAESNISSIRIGFSCETYIDQIIYGNKPEAIQQLENFKNSLALLDTAGIDVTLLLAYGSRENFKNIWAITGCNGSAPEVDWKLSRFPPLDDIWRQYVSGLIGEVGDHISGVEVWNEQNDLGKIFRGRIEDYVTLFRIAAVEVKNQYPAMPISTGGLSFQRAHYKSYLEGLMNPDTGVYNQCDAIGLHFYNSSSLEGLRIYTQVCSEMGLSPKPIWVTEYGRWLSEDPEKWNSLAGAEAFFDHVFEIFSSYGVERAFWFTISGWPDYNMNLFDWDDTLEQLSTTDVWDFYVSAGEKHNNFIIGDSIGYQVSGDEDLFGINPFEDFHLSNYPMVHQSTFEIVHNTEESFLLSRTWNNIVFPISFDVNDTWVQNNPYERLMLVVDILSTGDTVELRYQSCCEGDFVTTSAEPGYLDDLECPAFLDGLSLETVVPDFQKGVNYLENTNVEILELVPNTLTTVSIELSDWMFQNGMEKRSDFSFIPVNNETFEIHRVEIHPITTPSDIYSVEYTDKSAETLIECSSQPFNAMPLNYDGDEFNDLFISRYNDVVLAYKGFRFGPSGAPQFYEWTSTVLPTAIPEGINGMVSADFDNDGWIDFFATSPTNGGRLYRNINGEYYSDWTIQSGLSALLGNNHQVYNCSWADYDGDGFLDLTLILSDPHFGEGGLEIFHNNQGIFESTGIEYPSGFTPLWADFDNDGDLDLLSLQSKEFALCEPFSDFSTFLINQGDGTFTNEVWEQISRTFSYGGYGISVVVDFDNDGDLDVVFTELGGNLIALENYHNGNSGSGYFWGSSGTVYISGLNDYPTDLAVLDYDLDGYQDILMVFGPQSGYVGPASVCLLANRPTANGGRQFLDETASVNLTGSAPLSGLALADYNRDGFSDIFLSRASNESFFFKGKDPANERQNNWVGFSLESPAGANNTTGIGARVEVTAGSETYTQIVDGGSGFASQREADLVFGLGNYIGRVTVQVTWPNGRVQTQADLSTKQYHTIIDSTPVIDDSTVRFQILYHVHTGRQDWVFTWETLNETDTDKDKIHFDLSGVPDSCPPGIPEIHEQFSAVDVIISPLGWGKYQHTLTFRNVDCEPRCNIPYSVESAAGGFKSISSSRQIKIRTCLVGP